MDWTNIRAALTSSGLTARNWSGAGEVVLALYDAEGYIGAVRVEGTKAFMTGPKWWSRHAEAFNRFATALASETKQETSP
jgi:hypothetical protein